MDGYLHFAEQCLPYDSFRPGQRQLMEISLAAAIMGKSALAEAPTGAGKTLGSLLPLLYLVKDRGWKVSFITTTKKAQEFVECEIEKLNLLYAPTVCQLYGREEYVCPHCSRIAGYEKKANTLYCHLVDCKYHCPAKEAMTKAREADVLITNYYKYCLSRPALIEDPKKNVLVIDEIHDFKNCVQSISTYEISNYLLEKGITALQDSNTPLQTMLPYFNIEKMSIKKKHIESIDLLQSLNEFIYNLKNDCTYTLRLSEMESIVHLSKKLVDALPYIVISHILDDKRTIPSLYQILLSFSNISPREYTFYGKPFGQDFHIVALPRSLKNRFGDIYSSARSVVGISATIGSYDMLLKELFLPQDTLFLQVEQSFFDLQRQQIISLTDGGYMSKNSKRFQYERKLANDILARAARYTDVNTLILFRSFSDLNSAYERLQKEPNVSERLLVHKRSYDQTEMRRLISDFKTSEKGILLGCDSFWQSVDFPTDELNFVIIDSLPFPNPSDPYVKEKIKTLRRRGFREREVFLHAFMYPMSMKLLQGIGRLIRTPADFGTVIIQDRRFKRYYPSLLTHKLFPNRLSRNLHLLRHSSALRATLSHLKKFSREGQLDDPTIGRKMDDMAEGKIMIKA